MFQTLLHKAFWSLILGAWDLFEAWCLVLGHSGGRWSHFRRRVARRRPRRGSATVDYFLLFAIVLPLAGLILGIAPRMIQSVYDMMTVVVAWPFM
jgi:nitrate reductase gamma subunit